MKKHLTTLLIFLAFGAQAQSIKQLKQDMNGIASDATEGRFTGSTGYLKAARYVAGQLKAAGLKTTFQAVPFIWDNYDGSFLVIGSKTYPHQSGNFLVLQHSASGSDRILSQLTVLQYFSALILSTIKHL